MYVYVDRDVVVVLFGGKECRCRGEKREGEKEKWSVERKEGGNEQRRT